jgi:hypothetical protein
MGCYREPDCNKFSAFQELDYWTHGLIHNLTPEKCVALAGSLGYAYAAVMYHLSCLAGGSPD